MIDAYIELKMQDVTRFRMTTHPIEFDMLLLAVKSAVSGSPSLDGEPGYKQTAQ